MRRLGSEYQDPRDGDQVPSVQHARLAFLQCIEEDAPDVLSSLRADVLPQFAACPSGEGERWMAGAALAGERVLQQCEQWAELSAFATAYQAWANRWGLTDQWLQRIMIPTLDHWRQMPELTRFNKVGWGFWVHEVNVPPCSPFRPKEETQKSFEARVAAWVRENVAAGENLQREENLIQSPVLRTRQGDALRHWRWLVRRHCLRESYFDIANNRAGDENVSEDNVSRQVRATARLIGLTLRK